MNFPFVLILWMAFLTVISLPYSLNLLVLSFIDSTSKYLLSQNFHVSDQLKADIFYWSF